MGAHRQVINNCDLSLENIAAFIVREGKRDDHDGLREWEKPSRSSHQGVWGLPKMQSGYHFAMLARLFLPKSFRANPEDQIGPV